VIDAEHRPEPLSADARSLALPFPHLPFPLASTTTLQPAATPLHPFLFIYQLRFFLVLILPTLQLPSCPFSSPLASSPSPVHYFHQHDLFFPSANPFLSLGLDFCFHCQR
jgi:hypothetical protein